MRARVSSASPRALARGVVKEHLPSRLRRYVEPLPLVPASSAGYPESPAEMDLGFPTQAGGRRALRWSVTPAAKRETTFSDEVACSVSRFSSGATPLAPRQQTLCDLASSWTRHGRSLVQS